MFNFKIHVLVLLFFASLSNGNTCVGFANYSGVKSLFSPGQSISKNLGPLVLKGYQKICNRSGQCTQLKPVETRIGLYWNECTQSNSGSCHYEDRFDYVSLSAPTKSIFFIQGNRTDLVFAFNLPDSKGFEHSYYCRIDGGAIKNGEVTCVQNAFQGMFLVWNQGRTGLSFKGYVSNNCINVNSQYVVTNNETTSYINYEISGSW